MGVPKFDNNEESKINRVKECEKKRLESLKKRKETFRAKELAVQYALKNLDKDANRHTKKLSEVIDGVKQHEIKNEEKGKRPVLFNDDDKNQNWDTNSFEFKVDKSGKAVNRPITLGNDERFKLNKHFMEDNNEFNQNSSIREDKEMSGLQKEKAMELDILENILGVPLAQKNSISKVDSKLEKKAMVRYDPTEIDHKEYEIIAEKTEENSKKVKTKKRSSMSKNTENPPVEVSKDVYFSVSNSLSKSLSDGGQFRLLKNSSKEESTEEDKRNYSVTSIEPSKNKQFQFSFDTKNPFKYDSSDDENDTKEISLKNDLNDVPKETNKFFFEKCDVRFNEAKKFFSKDSTLVDDFQNLRRELKQIVRLKVQRNVKKAQPWGKKKRTRRF